MHSYNAGSRAATLRAERRGAINHGNVIIDEPTWRTLPNDLAEASSERKVVVTRWHAIAEQTQEFKAETTADRHVVKIVLRTMNLRLSVAGRSVLDGAAAPGLIHVTEPSAAVRCLFRGPYDVVHLHVPNDFIAECAANMPGRSVAALGGDARPSKDPMVEQLARALVAADQLGGSLGQLYADCISVAIVARLVAMRQQASSERPKVSELVRWRLKRAIDFVESRLAEPVSLADIASATGLTRMHFAAQFRAATGLRPHEYLLRRRIERAQEMLVGTPMSLVDVALSVGFQTQSHFTSVFKRFVGEPPRAWRQSHSERACQDA